MQKALITLFAILLLFLINAWVNGSNVIPDVSASLKVIDNNVVIDVEVSASEKVEKQYFVDILNSVTLNSLDVEIEGKPPMVLPQRSGLIEPVVLSKNEKLRFTIIGNISRLTNENRYKVDFGRLGYFYLQPNKTIALSVTVYEAEFPYLDSIEYRNSKDIYLALENET